MGCCFGRQLERGHAVLDRYLPAEPVALGTPTAIAFAARHLAAGKRDGCRKWHTGYARLMRFGVLGPLEVRANGEQLAIKGVKERRFLGLLLSRANSVVPVNNIFEALWGTEPPPSAAKSVQEYAVRVRKMLEPNGRPAESSLVSRRGAGYMLRAARDRVDALRFADLVARAREAAGAGDIAAQV